MDFRRLGNSGLVVSVVGLGTNNFGMKLDFEQTRKVVYAALDEGVTFFDTADAYGESEERLGKLLAGRRDDVVLATKFGQDLTGGRAVSGQDWGARGSRRYIRRAVESSLRRLRTDWIDLYQLHLPDPQTPVEETLTALTELVREGKVRYLGSSNFNGFQAAEAEWQSRSRGLERFVSAQNRYSWLHREAEDELVRALEHYGIGLLPYLPLASGLLTGKYRRGEPPPADSRIHAWGLESRLTDEAFDVIERLASFAGQRDISLLAVAIGGLAAKPMVASVIAGATTPAQVAANVAAGRWRPTHEEMAELDTITA